MSSQCSAVFTRGPGKDHVRYVSLLSYLPQLEDGFLVALHLVERDGPVLLEPDLVGHYSYLSRGDGLPRSLSLLTTAALEQ